MKDMSLSRLFATVVIIVLGIWFTLNIVIPIVTGILAIMVPLAMLAIVGFIVWQVLNYDPDKTTTV